jgi:hypothetical protein
VSVEPSPWVIAVAVSPNTAMASARRLADAAELYRRHGQADDGDVCDELARRLSRAMQRAGWPDPLDPWPG